MYLSQRVKKALESIIDDPTVPVEQRVRAAAKLGVFEDIRSKDKRYRQSKQVNRPEPLKDGPLSHLVEKMRDEGILPGRRLNEVKKT